MQRQIHLSQNITLKNQGTSLIYENLKYRSISAR